MSNPVDAQPQPQGALDILGLNAELLDGHPAAGEATDFDGPDSAPISDSEKLDFLYQTAVRVQNLIDQVTPDDIGKIQKTVSNPLVRKMLGL